jgi:WD40 repeat protein
MSEEFDAYYKWLAIPPEEQPPDHYRLLGLKRFELDLDVIESAADQRMAHLRKYQSGQHSAASQRILNEVAAAKLVLLTPDKRSAYDAQLRRQLEERPLPQASPIGASPVLPTATPIGSPPAPVAPPSSPEPITVAPVITPVAAPVTPVSGSPAADAKASSSLAARRGKKQPPWVLPAMIGGGMAGVLALLLCAGGLYALLSSGDQEVVVNDPNPEGVRVPGVVQPAVRPIDPATPAASGDEDGDDDGFVEPEKPTPPDNPVVDDPASPDPMPPDPASPEPMPEPEPEPAPPSPEPSPMPEPAPAPAAPQAAKPAPPSAEEQAKALATIDDVLNVASAETDEAKIAKAEEMIRVAKEPGTKQVNRFALLRRATDLAKTAGDAALMLRAVDEMEQMFEFDADNARAALLTALARNVRSPKSVETLMRQSEDFLDEAVLRDRVDLAYNLATTLRDTVPSKGTTGKAYRKQLNDRYNALRKLQASWKRMQQARTTLESNADDPDANLAVGRYLSLTRGDFAAAVEYLAKSDDAPLKAAAEKDLAAQGSDDAAVLLAAGDAWYELADADPANNAGYYARAHHFYEPIAGDLGSLDKLRVETRLGEIAKNEVAQRLIAGAEALARLNNDAPTRVVARQLATFSGAGSGEIELAFLPDGKTLATGGSDGALKLWDIKTHQAKATYPAHSGGIEDLTVSDDGVIVTTGADYTALMWNEKGERRLLARSDTRNGRYRVAKFAPDGTLVMARDDDVTFWDVPGEKEKRQPRVVAALKADYSYFNDISIAGDGSAMAFMTSNKVVLLGRNGPIPPVDPAQQAAQTAALSPDGKRLAIAPNTGKVVLYDESAGKPGKRRELDTASSIRHMAFTPDGKTLAVVPGYGSRVQLVDVETGAPWQTVDTGYYIYSLELSRDGKLMATAGSDGAMTVWEIKRERILSQPPTKADLAGSDEPGANWFLRGSLDFGADIQDVQFSPTGARLAVTDGNSVRIYNSNNGAPQLALTGHQQSVLHIAWSADSKRIATASYDRTTRVWDSVKGTELGQIHDSRVPKVISFSPDGSKLMIVTDDGVRFHAVPAGATSTQFDIGAGSSVYSAAASPDASSFALTFRTLTGRHSQLGLYDFDSQKPKIQYPDSNVLAISFGGTHVIAYSNYTLLRVYSAESNKPLSTLKMSGYAQAAAFHPGGKMVAVGNYDHAVSLWDIRSGKLIQALAGHKDGINDLDFSADGKSLATASDDNTVKIWSPRKVVMAP